MPKMKLTKHAVDEIQPDLIDKWTGSITDRLEHSLRDSFFKTYPTQILLIMKVFILKLLLNLL